MVKDGCEVQVQGNKSIDHDDMRPYFIRRNELSVDNGCILWGSRVIIPSRMRKDVLNLLHATHMGMSQTKALARGYVWWPCLDGDIEQVVRNCDACKLNQSKPASSVPHPWAKPSGPWERIHLDFCGPFYGFMWLVVIDAFSKWIEIKRMSSTKSGPVIRELRELFSRFGLPKIVCSDNGPQLTSDEMKNFMTKNGINHVLIPAWHPASNGQAESVVGKFKHAMKRMCSQNPDILHNLANWLMIYRNTPHTATGVEPSVAMLGRRTRNAFSLLHPLNSSRSVRKGCRQEQRILDSKTSSREFDIGDRVIYWDELHKNWNEGTVKELQGSKVLVISTEKGDTRKHLDHVRKDKSNTEPEPVNNKFAELKLAAESGEVKRNPDSTGHDHKANLENVPSTNSEHYHEASLRFGQPNIEPSPISSDNKPETKINIRPKRVKIKPDRLNYTKLGGD